MKLLVDHDKASIGPNDGEHFRERLKLGIELADYANGINLHVTMIQRLGNGDPVRITHTKRHFDGADSHADVAAKLRDLADKVERMAA